MLNSISLCYSTLQKWQQQFGFMGLISFKSFWIGKCLLLRSFIESSGLKEVIAAWILRLFVKSDKIGIVRDDV